MRYGSGLQERNQTRMQCASLCNTACRWRSRDKVTLSESRSAISPWSRISRSPPHCFSPHCVRAATGSEGSSVEVGGRVDLIARWLCGTHSRCAVGLSSGAQSGERLGTGLSCVQGALSWITGQSLDPRWFWTTTAHHKARYSQMITMRTPFVGMPDRASQSKRRRVRVLPSSLRKGLPPADREVDNRGSISIPKQTRPHDYAATSVVPLTKNGINCLARSAAS